MTRSFMRAQMRGADTLSMTAPSRSSGLRPFEQRVGRERDAVAQGRQRDALDVVGRHEVAAFEQRHGARAAHQRQRAARARAHAPGPDHSRVARARRTA